MSSDTSDSSSYIGELIRTHVQKWPGTDGKMTLGLHFLDLESDEVFIRAMPPDAPLSPLPLPVATTFTFLGEYAKMMLLLVIGRTLNVGGEKLLLFCSLGLFPLVLAAEGKIYVFELLGFESFGDVYDISGDIWEPLSPPPEAIALCGPVLLDSPRSQILVLFTLITMIVNHGFASNQNFVTGLTQRQSWTMCCILSCIIILWIHQGVALCLVWAMASVFCVGSTITMSFEYIRFNMWCNEQGGIHAAAEHQSAITVPYRSKDFCDIFLF
ncbi:hypothetical protein GOBAR_DD06682 [Gossypium barbadense]|nr:hypothetical protein GOBAR_DD06682 [Gossypium barbadense]